MTERRVWAEPLSESELAIIARVREGGTSDERRRWLCHVREVALALAARVEALEAALRSFVPAGPRYLSIGSINNVVEVRVTSQQFAAAQAALAAVPPADEKERV